MVFILEPLELTAHARYFQHTVQCVYLSYKVHVVILVVCPILYIMQSSGVVYADVEALQRKIKPPPEDDIVQYQTVLPQPAIPDPTPQKLPLKSMQFKCVRLIM